MNENVYWMLDLSVKEGALENFRRLMEEMVESTRANEPGTLNYEWSISDDGKHCHIYERYADSMATLAHLETFGNRYAERFMQSVDISRFMVYGNPSEEVRKAMSGLGTVFMSPFGGFAR